MTLSTFLMTLGDRGRPWNYNLRFMGESAEGVLMLRKARINTSGDLQHIVVRGIERRRIGRDEADSSRFLDRLASVLQKPTACYAWALMPNHVHLLLRMGKEYSASVTRRLWTGYEVRVGGEPGGLCARGGA